MGFFDPGASWLAGSLAGTPKVPTWQNLSLSGSQTGAIGANAASLPGIESLATGVDTFNENQLMQLLNSIMPGWSGAAGQAGQNITSELEGKVPADVQNMLQSSEAAKALAGGMGFGAGTLGGSDVAKSLGLTSLGLMNQGMSSLESWTGMIDRMFAPGQFNVSSMFISPQQEFEDTMANQEKQWDVNWLKSQTDWSGSAGKLLGDEINQSSQQFNSLISSIVSKYAGSMMGGMGGGGGGA